MERRREFALEGNSRRLSRRLAIDGSFPTVSSFPHSFPQTWRQPEAGARGGGGEAAGAREDVEGVAESLTGGRLDLPLLSRTRPIPDPKQAGEAEAERRREFALEGVAREQLERKLAVPTPQSPKPET